MSSRHAPCIDVNGTLEIVAAKQPGRALHQNQMSESGQFRIEQARDLERNFAIAVTNDSTAIAQCKCDIEAALAADVGDRNVTMDSRTEVRGESTKSRRRRLRDS